MNSDSRGEGAVPEPRAPGYGPAPGPAPGRGPHLAWIFACAALILVLGLIAVGGPVISIINAAPTTTFANEEEVTVPLDPADEPVIYVSATQPGYSNCGILGGPSPDGLALTEAVDAGSVEVDGVAWQPLFHIGVPVAGEYQLLCSTESDATFGVGSALRPIPSPPFQLLIFACTGGLAAMIVRLFKQRRAARRGQ